MGNRALRISSILLFSALFYVISVSGSIEIPSIVRYAIIILLSGVLIIREKKLPNQFFPDVFNVSWLLLVLITCISIVYNNASFNGLINTILIYVLYFIVIAYNISSLKDISIGLLIFGDILLIECLQMQPLVLFWYHGIMRNPNQLGLTFVASYVACLYLIFSSYKINNRIMRYLIIANGLLYIFIIWCTSCRSALLACVVSTLIIALYIIKDNINLTKRKVLGVSMIICILALILIFNIDSIALFINKTFIYKYSSSTDNISSNRFDMWKQIINESKIWGYGDIYLACHNDYFVYVQKYGVAFSSIFYLYILLTLSTLSKLNISAKEKIFYALFIISCVIVSMFEEIISMFGKPLVIMMFISMGLIIKNYREREV